jgi:hypothetical protein
MAKRKPKETEPPAEKKLTLRDQWDTICEMVANGMHLREIGLIIGCDCSAISKVAGSDPALGQQYARARETSADAFEAQILNIARNATNEDYQVNRLQVDTLKWVAARRNFKRYGDRQQVDAVHDITEGMAERMARARASVPEPK